MDGKAVPIAVDECDCTGAGPFHRCAGEAGDRRAQPVGAHGDPGADLERRAALVPPDNAGHPSVAVAAQAGDSHAEAHLGAGIPGGIDQDRVEHGAAGGVEGVDAGTRFDGYVNAILAIVEHAPSHRRGSGGGDLVEQAPAGKLQHPCAHEGVGRDGVGAVLAAVDHQDPQARLGQDHRGGGSGRPGPDDDDVVGRLVERCHEVSHRADAMPKGRRSRAARWLAMNSASWRTPSMKLELRRC